jgi:hypothetical protein
MAYTVHQIESWDDVLTIAASDPIATCIRPGGPNHEKAAATWGQHYPGSLRYYIRDPPGYMRLLKLTQATHHRLQTWAVDFAKPMDYEFIIAVAQIFEHTLLVKRVNFHSPASNQALAKC